MNNMHMGLAETNHKIIVLYDGRGHPCFHFNIIKFVDLSSAVMCPSSLYKPYEAGILAYPKLRGEKTHQVVAKTISEKLS